MIKDHHKSILKANLEKHGADRIRLKLVEELSELLAEVSKYRFKRGSQDEISREFADVLIVLYQLGFEIDMNKTSVEDKYYVELLARLIIRVNDFSVFLMPQDFSFLPRIKKYLHMTLVAETIEHKVNRLANKNKPFQTEPYEVTH